MVNAGDEFPAGEDYLVRRMKDLERKVDQNASSIPRSFQTTVDALTAQIASIAALQAVAVTPVTTVATSTATSLPFSLTATMVVPAGATRCFYTTTASVYGQSTGSFQVKFNVSAPSTGSTGYLSAGAAPFAGSDTSSAVGALTGLTPGATLSFTAFIGSTFSGTISLLESRISALGVFQP